MNKKQLDPKNPHTMVAKFNERLAESLIPINLVGQDFRLVEHLLDKSMLEIVTKGPLTEEMPPIEPHELFLRLQWLRNKAAMLSHVVNCAGAELKVLVHVLGQLDSEFYCLNVNRESSNES